MSGESIRAMHPLFQAGEGGSIPTSPLQLLLCKVNHKTAAGLVFEWHSVMPRELG